MATSHSALLEVQKQALQQRFQQLHIPERLSRRERLHTRETLHTREQIHKRERLRIREQLHVLPLHRYYSIQTLTPRPTRSRRHLVLQAT